VRVCESESSPAASSLTPPGRPAPVCREEGAYLRLIDTCITQLRDQGASRTCNESKEEEDLLDAPPPFIHSTNEAWSDCANEPRHSFAST